MTIADVYQTWVDRIIASRAGFLYWRDDSSEEYGHIGVVWHRINERQMQGTELHCEGEPDDLTLNVYRHPPEPISFASIR